MKLKEGDYTVKTCTEQKTYTAYINEFDRDYHCFCGTEEIQVDSVEEAREHCRKQTWSGYSYNIHNMRHNTTKEWLWKK